MAWPIDNALHVKWSTLLKLILHIIDFSTVYKHKLLCDQSL